MNLKPKDDGAVAPTNDLDDGARLETLLSEQLAILLTATPDTIDQAVMETQRELCRLLGMDRSAIWQGSSEAPQTIRITHLSTQDDAPPIPKDIAAFSAFPWITGQILEGKTVAVSDVDALPPEAATDRETLRHYLAKSTVAVPFARRTGYHVGAMAFTSTARPRPWSEAMLTHCRLVAQVMSTVLARAQSEAALRSSELLYRSLIHQVNVGIFLLKPDGPMVHVNPMMARLSGYASADEILALPKGVLWANAEDGERALATLAREGSINNFETRLACKDGSSIPVSLNAVTLREAPEAPELVLGTIEDIRARKQAEEELRINRARLLATLDNTPAVAIQWYDEEGRVTYWNPASESIFGWRSAEVLGRTLDAFLLAPEEAAQFHQALSEIRATGRAVGPYEARIRRRDGSSGWVLSTTFAIPAEEGHTNFVCMDVDITERKRAEEALRQSEFKARAIFDLSFGFIGLLSPDGILLEVNRTALDFVGVQASDVVGQPFWDTPWWSHSPAMRELIRTAVHRAAGGEFVRDEAVHLARDGSIHHIDFTLKPVRDDAGRVVFLIPEGRDFTERKNAENALLNAFEEIKTLKERLAAENVILRDEVQLTNPHGKIVRDSRAMRSVMAQAEQVATTDSTVLILGETGTGKELLARAIHAMGLRKDRPLVILNCAAIPAGLVESELFGREKGAFTGALAKELGRFEVANGGTIFLDEIGELSLEIQAKLLRVLQEGELQRLGSTKTVKVDVRVLAATNRDLQLLVAEGRFRQDLYYRLNVFPINVPPLRERPEDIPPLVLGFVHELSQRMGKSIASIPQKSMDALERYPWPGNVRELRNMVERAMIMARDTTLRIEVPVTATATSLPSTLDEAQRQHILRALGQTHWRLRGKNGAAALLGLNESTLRSRMARLGIKRPGG